MLKIKVWSFKFFIYIPLHRCIATVLVRILAIGVVVVQVISSCTVHRLNKQKYMSCRNHTVEVNMKNGKLHCPECKHQFTDEEARRCLFEIFRNIKSARHVLKMFKIVSASVMTKSVSKKRKLSLRMLKHQERYLKDK